jgi:cobalt-zinc-cadmium efflux system outer membrane protein
MTTQFLAPSPGRRSRLDFSSSFSLPSDPVPMFFPVKTAVWAVATLAFASLAVAQEPAAPAPRMPEPVERPAPAAWRLADLEGMALRFNPTLAQAAAAIGQQEGIMRQVGLYPNPQGGYLRSDSNDNQNRSNGIFAAQEIVTAKKLQLNRAVEAQEIVRLRADQEAQRQRVVNDLRIRYFEMLGAQEAVAISSVLYQLAEEGVGAAERLYQARGASRPDVLQARIQRSAVRMTLEDARLRHAAAWRQLTAVIGRTDLPQAPVEGRLDEPTKEIEFNQAFEDLMALSPQIRAADSRIGHARRELAREQAQPIPNVTAQVVAEFDRSTNVTTVSTLLAAPIPVFNRNQGNISHAMADIREAMAESQRVRLVLRDQLSETFRRYQAAKYQVNKLRGEILVDARENLELVTAGQKQGEFNLFQVLVARETYFQSQLTYVEALVELQKVVVEIEGLQLTGGLNPAELGAAVQSTGSNAARQKALLNQLQESNTKQILPPAIQAVGP